MIMSHFIKLAAARQMTRVLRDKQESILDPAFRDQGIIPTCETFDRIAIDKILGQPGCTQFRIYYGMGTDLKIHAILVGVDANDTDILPGGDDLENEMIAEMSRRCPDICPNNPL
jgi:hypothetical protein